MDITIQAEDGTEVTYTVFLDGKALITANMLSGYLTKNENNQVVYDVYWNPVNTKFYLSVDADGAVDLDEDRLVQGYKVARILVVDNLHALELHDAILAMTALHVTEIGQLITDNCTCTSRVHALSGQVNATIQAAGITDRFVKTASFEYGAPDGTADWQGDQTRHFPASVETPAKSWTGNEPSAFLTA